MEDSNVIVYDPMQAKHLNDVERCLSESFLYREPMTSYLKPSADEFLDFLRPLLQLALEQGLSWVALDRASHKLVACRIATDFYADYSPANLSEKMNIIVTYLGLLSQPVHDLLVGKSRVLHGQMLGVDAAYTQRGIAAKLVKHVATNAYERGFCGVVAEATSAYTQKIAMRIPGSVIINRLDYESFEWDGVFPFKGLRTPMNAWSLFYPLGKHIARVL